MKKLFLALLLVSIAFSSCKQESKKDSQAVLPKRKIDNVLSKILNDKFPNYRSNNLIKGKAVQEIKVKIDSLAPLNYLDDIPLQVLNISKNPHGKGALVQFTTNGNNIVLNNNYSDNVCFDVISFMSEEIASTLIDKEIYYVYGKKWVRLDKKEVNALVKYTWYGTETEINNDDNDIILGNFLVEVDSLKLYEK